MSGISSVYMKYLMEAVQNVDVSFIEPIFNKLVEFNKTNQVIKDNIKFLNSLLMEQHSIEIFQCPEKSHGHTSFEGYIRLFVNSGFFYDIQNDGRALLNELKTLLKHEFTHRIHSTKVGNFFNPIQYDTKDKEKYMKDKHEIMAYANQTIQEFVSDGLTKEEILEYLKNTKYYQRLIDASTWFQMYLYHFWPHHDKRPIQNYRDRKTLDLYFKYLYQYLDSKYPGMEYNPKFQLKDYHDE